ncbi:MAG TPA: helix-turn-helix transcriptional regulator [Gaiellaceae bacterium]|nr:helix-turn-helix transcriptional regulator [Gaiellaceae bacterium]
MAEIRTGAPAFRTEASGRISAWNAGCEELTGIPAAVAEGHFCWEVIRGRGADGSVVCHPGCSIARLARQGWPVRCTDLHMRTPTGEKRVTISTISVRAGDETTVLHPLRESAPAAAPAAPAERPALTRRQLEILGLLAEGVRARQIAARLTLSETTVRNHIRAILGQLGAHSQLEAVARARALALLREEPAA